jgi:hypothetical protein
MNGTATNALGTRPLRPAQLQHTFVLSLVRRANLTLLALLTPAGMLLVARRLGGALVEPLPVLTLLAVGVLLAGAALLIRRPLAQDAESSRWQFALGCATSVALLLWMLAITLPGTNPLGLVFFCGAILLEEGWSWGRFRLGDSASVTPPPVSELRAPSEDSAAASAVEITGVPVALAQSPAPAPTREGLLNAFAEKDAVEDSSALEEATYDQAVSQQIVRRRDEAGEVITGWVRVEFAQVQRVAAAHIAICPPLERNPTCEAEQQDGPSAEVKLTQAMPYGVRLEVKLEEPAEEATSVIVEFAIQAE